MPTLSPQEIYQICLEVGFSPDDAVTWTAIAMAESGGNTGAHNPNGEDSWGLWQININPAVRENTWGDLTDPRNNARAALELSGGGERMSPWTVTHDSNRGTNRDYRNFLDDASAASGGQYQGDNRGVTGYGGGPSTPGDDPNGAGSYAMSAGGGADDGSETALQTFLESARAQAGDPYVWASEASSDDDNPDAFDCCLAEGSLVVTERGPVPIEEVEAGDVVTSWRDSSAERRKVVAVLAQGEQEVFRLRTRNRAVVATANHPFLVVRRAPRRRVGVPVEWWTEWTRLDEIRRGDLVVTLDHLDHEATETALSDGTLVTADIAWLLGVLVGDGTVRRNDVRVCVFGALRDRVRTVIEHTWGLACDDHATAGLLVRRNGVLSRVLLDALDGVWAAPDKRVPRLVWQLSPGQQRAFLDGLADADGHTDRRGYRAYHSASRRLVGEARMLHVLLGDSVSNLTTTHGRQPIVINGKAVRTARPLHSFQVYPGSRRRGQTQLDTYGARRAVPDRRFSAERVLGVDAVGVAPTWDLEVEGAHNFVADGVVVHNSELVQWSASRAGIELPDGSWLQYLEMQEQGTTMTVEEALRTPGALLFSFSSEPTAGSGRPSSAHVAISLGDGTTIEARGRRWGVGEWEAGDRFTHAAVIPGMATTLPAAVPEVPLVPVDTDLDDDLLDDALEMSIGTNPGMADTDGDGLLDGFEVAIGTDPLKMDTDADGLSDAYEMARSHTNPLAADTDGDTVSDSLEVAAGTDAVEGAQFTLGTGTTPGAFGLGVEVDTDRDGLSDARETILGSNAADADTDKDGLIDGLEVTAGTDLFKADTDSDGLSDAFELSFGTDPLNADTDRDGLFDGAELAAGSDPGQSSFAPGPAPADAGGGVAVATAPAPAGTATEDYELALTGDGLGTSSVQILDDLDFATPDVPPGAGDDDDL